MLGDVYATLLSGTVSKLCGSHSDKCDWPPSLGWGFLLCHKGMAQPDDSDIVHCLFFLVKFVSGSYFV